MFRRDGGDTRVGQPGDVSQNRARIDTISRVMGTIDRLLEVAVSQHGLFTVEQAASVGVGDAQVRRLASVGTVERRAQGVYRIAAIPFDDRTEFVEAVLWAKGRALVAGESALLVWDLADVNPRKIHLVISPNYRPRRTGAELYAIHYARVPDDDRDDLDGVAIVAPARAIEQAIAWGVPGDMIEQAVRRAGAREHIGPSTAQRLRGLLAARIGRVGARVR